MEEGEGMHRRVGPPVNSVRRRAVERLRRIRKPRDGPPPPGSMDAYLASLGFKPHLRLQAVGYENMDPAILAHIPERIRTKSKSGPMSEIMPPPPTLSAIIAATTGYRAQGKGGGGATVPNKDLGNSSEPLVENLKLEDIHISN